MLLKEVNYRRVMFLIWFGSDGKELDLANLRLNSHMITVVAYQATPRTRDTEQFANCTITELDSNCDLQLQSDLRVTNGRRSI